ncbi:response regulator [Gordonia soli]|uniref:Transcriptional regulatory protein n=1 Tax=Gordonia soli NBRC 108243 TaxID=1223545 RepID=M0QK95_9ACTN|nr:response regulator [Gordonia soli]GAC69060.1 putative two-component response regulator [Gordonia soli NBRC 108243]
MIRVLIVEDEPLIAEAHRAYLERVGGFEVVDAVGTAQEALRVVTTAAAGDDPVDLVLLDLGLPDARGVDLASALSGTRPDPDIIAITAQRDLATVRSAMSRGVLLYLIKPFTYAAFREKIEQYLRYRDALPAGTDAVSQRDVDRALAELRTADIRRSAKKGAAPETEDAVARAVRDSATGRTASEVAVEVGTSRVTAWRYLERLADDGTLDRTTEYGSAGRPQVRYRWRRR